MTRIGEQQQTAAWRGSKRNGMAHARRAA